ncbi:Gamma aminobutyrate transaminase 3, chloroplastic [Mesorhizobium plurifarium]|uniref:Gamma aminobutyrate transaminase 3, chloroplastic n=1 Tax=Mesorhizobium plurifarium TaxID=69974 RepID=A0A0K2VRK2_MESPL|nr:Gamma aminobutyrate transaminase 3, chloroplastic [Mesorhizobium plurifarium]
MLHNSARAIDMSLHLHSQTDPRRHEQDGPLIVSGGDGVYVRDDAGNRYIEGMAGLWTASLGFNDQRLAAAAAAQFAKLANYHTFNHRSNEPCIDLIEQLAAVSPISSSKIFLANSGSEANDSMIKLAWYYQAARGKPEKRRIISRNGAFHGSTVMGAVLSGLPHMHRSFGMNTDDILYAGKPHFYREGQEGESEQAFADRLIAELEAMILAAGPDTIAAMIAEPVMGAGGVIVPPTGYFPKLRQLLDKHDILLLADEVVCGFGRTGNWFGSQTFGFKPDMFSVAKGLSSGYLPIAAVVVSDALYQAIADEGHRNGVFGHGFTYSGHPVASAVAAEALRIYHEIDVVGRARTLGARMLEKLRDALADHPMVGEIRGVGLLAGVELVADRRKKQGFPAEARVGAQVERACRARGIILRNMGDVLALCPPYIIEPGQIDELVRALFLAIEDTRESLSL